MVNRNHQLGRRVSRRGHCSHGRFILFSSLSRARACERFEAIRRENSLRGLSIEDFATRAAEHAIELPFREGNGRALRAFLFVLARQAGHDIHMERIDARSWNEASRVSFRTGDTQAMRNVIADAIR